MASKTILVTGGCGYIGSHTIVDLIENDFDVICADSNVKSNVQAIENVAKIVGKKVRHYAIDLCDLMASRQIFEENSIDAIIHFAALKSVPESVAKPLWYYQNNLGSLTNLLQLSKEYGVKQFVFSSSCSVYGNTNILPVTEETPQQKPQSPYAFTKQMGEQILQDFMAQDKKLQIAILRYFNPVGAHKSALIGEWPIDVPNNLVPLIVGNASGKYKLLQVFGHDLPTRDGTCIRDYVHVMDVANAHTKALQFLQNNMDVLAEVFNIGSGTGTTVLEAINAFEKANNIKINYQLAAPRLGDVIAVYSDNAKAKKMLHWNIQFDLQEMMRSAWEWERQMNKMA